MKKWFFVVILPVLFVLSGFFLSYKLYMFIFVYGSDITELYHPPSDPNIIRIECSSSSCGYPAKSALVSNVWGSGNQIFGNGGYQFFLTSSVFFILFFLLSRFSSVRLFPLFISLVISFVIMIGSLTYVHIHSSFLTDNLTMTNSSFHLHQDDSNKRISHWKRNPYEAISSYQWWDFSYEKNKEYHQLKWGYFLYKHLVILETKKFRPFYDVEVSSPSPLSDEDQRKYIKSILRYAKTKYIRVPTISFHLEASAKDPITCSKTNIFTLNEKGKIIKKEHALFYKWSGSCWNETLPFSQKDNYLTYIQQYNLPVNQLSFEQVRTEQKTSSTWIETFDVVLNNQKQIDSYRLQNIENINSLYADDLSFQFTNSILPPDVLEQMKLGMKKEEIEQLIDTSHSLGTQYEEHRYDRLESIEYPLKNTVSLRAQDSGWILLHFEENVLVRKDAYFMKDSVGHIQDHSSSKMDVSKTPYFLHSIHRDSFTPKIGEKKQNAESKFILSPYSKDPNYNVVSSIKSFPEFSFIITYSDNTFLGVEFYGTKEGSMYKDPQQNLRILETFLPEDAILVMRSEKELRYYSESLKLSVGEGAIIIPLSENLPLEIYVKES